jgi:phosphatidylglycerophosphatase C
LPVIAAFDFDGTLSYQDALLPFFCFVKGTGKTCINLMLELPQLAGFPLGLTSRQAVKEGLIRRFLAGLSQDEASHLGTAFANTRLKELVKPEGLQRIQWHLQQGHRCILISAGLDLYLKPWGTQTGFRDIITSGCEIDKLGLITGRLAQPNCWGSEKTRRLTALLGPKEGYVLYAYGNSRGDKELLDMADFPFYRKFQ